MDPLLPFDRVAGLLPFGLRQLALTLPSTERIIAEEIRLRVGRPISVTLRGEERFLPGSPAISSKDIYTVLEIATQASAHTVLERVRQGFVTVRGGHRLGICGTVSLKEGEIHNVRYISSLNIRIARQVIGIGDLLLRQIRTESDIQSVLVLAPPGAGKTTLLRDLIRGLSIGVGGRPLRVGVVDERGELASLWDGVPQLDLGPHTDVIDGCAKAEGLMMLLRAMNPQVLAVDEITAPGDICALELAANCGVALLATAHGQSVNDLENRPLYSNLLQKKVFKKIIRIETKGDTRKYHVEELAC